MSLNDLRRKIDTQSAVVGVIGLGYVGLPVACIFAQQGFKVIGVDINHGRIKRINAGQSPIEGDEPGLSNLLAQVVNAGQLSATSDYNTLAKADVILVAVDTPVDAFHKPQYVALKSAMTSLGAALTPDTLVIIESTVAPGTVNGLVQPILEQTSALGAHTDFFLGACPERVMPGKLLANLRQMSRVCGGGTPQTAQAMVAFYRHVVEADLDAADIVTAELVKTAENTYRDVQIAFANEVALICEQNQADVWRVRELVNKSPGRNMHLPGAGVGGHCIPKDPWLLAHAATDNVPLKLIPAARAVNEGMPGHIAGMTVNALQAAGVEPAQAKVGVLGYAYLENSDDTRHSPTAALLVQLQPQVGEVAIHDPWVAPYQGDLYAALANCDALVLMVKHSAYRNIDFARLHGVMRTAIVIDGRGFFQPDAVVAAGFQCYGVGRGQ